MKISHHKHNNIIHVMLFITLAILWSICENVRLVAGDGSVCTTVKIQIDQTATLERQAFIATMTVNNSLSSGTLSNINVAVRFANGLGQIVGSSTNSSTTTLTDTNAVFFYRLTDGGPMPGSIEPSSSRTFKWLIIPTESAGGQDPSGQFYSVGATLAYTLNGSDQTIEVEPDNIRVLPMPRLILDYFLQRDVTADDPFTTNVIETAEPVTLGVRVRNAGYGPATNLKIESSQPKIVENQLDLLIDFSIVGCQLNNQIVEPSLLLNMGSIAPGKITVGRWIMLCSLSGYFSDFSARFSHAAEFGGQLTSLIQSVSTHSLVHDVLVDLPGRDSVKDFLTMDEDVVHIYESDNTNLATDGTIVHYEAFPTVDATELSTRFIVTPSYSAENLCSYLKMTDPKAGVMDISNISRSDGKVLNSNNIWLSHKRDPENNVMNYYFNIFDTNNSSGLAYIVNYKARTTGNRKPMLSTLSDRYIQPGRMMIYKVAATDPDGGFPSLSTGPLPAGASFTSFGDGTGQLAWQPDAGQEGRYSVRFQATDGQLSDSKTMNITVSGSNTSAFQAWKDRFWPGITDIAIVGDQADPDHDGISNLVEYAFDTNPTIENNSPVEIQEVSESGTSYLAISYPFRTDDMDLKADVVGADASLNQTWVLQSGTMVADQTGIPSGLTKIMVRDSVPIDEVEKRRLLRVKVSIP